MSTKIIKSKTSTPSVVKRFVQNEDGVAAIEFSVLIGPFLLLLFAILQTSLVYLAGTALEVGMQRAARTVQTESKILDEAGFREIVCDTAFMLPNCVTSLRVDVRAFNSFTAASFKSILLPDGTIDPDTNFDTGSRSGTVVVRVSYEWPLLLGEYNSGLGNMAELGNGNRLLTASWAFQNEPT